MPRQGWDDEQIKFLMRDLALMDSNNFVDNVGVGEREGRVYSRFVWEREGRESGREGREGHGEEKRDGRQCQRLVNQIL